MEFPAKLKELFSDKLKNVLFALILSSSCKEFLQKNLPAFSFDVFLTSATVESVPQYSTLWTSVVKICFKSFKTANKDKHCCPEFYSWLNSIL